MFMNRSLVAALAASTVFIAGAAYAADQAAPQMSSQQKSTDQEIGKLSAMGAKAYMEVNGARVAIFDGRVKDAKKLVSEAASDISKARGDETAFMKAEADMRGSQTSQAGETDQTGSNPSASKQNASNENATNGGAKQNADDQASAADMKTPKEWLPVDGEMAIDEDLSANPTKQAAVADANKSLEKGDKKGAMEKLKVADINIDYAVAVVPLKQTISDIDQAQTLMNQGKYYEASQMLRDVQDSTRFDVLDINGVPKKAAANTTGTSESASAGTAKPATH